MSNFDQKKQNVNTQLNVAGNVILGDDEAIIWIRASNSDRYFIRKRKERIDKGWKESTFLNPGAAILKPVINKMLDKKPETERHVQLLLSEKDFCAVIQDEKNNIIIEEKFNAGEIIKINLRRGKYKVVITTVIDENREEYRYVQESSNFLTVPVSSSEVVKLNFDTISLKLNFSN